MESLSGLDFIKLYCMLKLENCK